MGKIKAEMAGTVLELKVKEGDAVESGQEIAIVESMKMEVPIAAPEKGTVTKIYKKEGDFLNEGDPLFEIS